MNNKQTDLFCKTKICFLLGIDNRCGTNFLFKLLDCHPHCSSPGIIGEDYFLKNTEVLEDYVEKVHSRWDSKWEIGKKLNVGNTHKLLKEYLGSAIENFLKIQLTKESAEQTTSKEVIPDILLTKTPSVEMVDSFFDFFPNAYLILLVRDGRALVESGVRSFKWKYDTAARRWRDRSQTILDFQEKYREKKDNFIILRYEDVISDQKRSLLDIFSFLGLDPDVFDFEKAESLGVIGSSDLKKKGAKIHWEMTKKEADFNPLSRFSNWNRNRHERFNWIAGEQMEKLGYELNVSKRNKHINTIKNIIIDLIVIPKNATIAFLKKIVKKMLKAMES